MGVCHKGRSGASELCVCSVLVGGGVDVGAGVSGWEDTTQNGNI